MEEKKSILSRLEHTLANATDEDDNPAIGTSFYISDIFIASEALDAEPKPISLTNVSLYETVSDVCTSHDLETCRKFTNSFEGEEYTLISGTTANTLADGSIFCILRFPKQLYAQYLSDSDQLKQIVIKGSFTKMHDFYWFLHEAETVVLN